MGFLPPVSMRICGTLQSPNHQYAQVDAVGNAWVAGSTDSSLDGNSNAGLDDIFLNEIQFPGRPPVDPPGWW